MTFASSHAAIAIGTAVVLLGTYAPWALDGNQLAGARLGIRRFATPPVSGTVRIGQRFRMNASGLRAIEIQARAAATVSGMLRLQLRSLDGAGASVVRNAEVSAVDLVRGESYRFAFIPLEDSENHSYELEISTSPDTPGSGVALWATKGESYRDGTLLINSVERWADLAFQTDAVGMPSQGLLFPWQKLRRPATRVVLVMLGASWIGLMFVLRQIARRHTSSGTEG